MWAKFRTWLDDIAFSDPLEHYQAGLLQIILLIIIASSLMGMPVSLVTSVAPGDLLLPLTIYPLLIICTTVALVLLRRGNFVLAVYAICGSLILAIGVSTLAAGLERSETILLSFTIPIVLGGLLIGRNGLIATLGLCIVAIGAVAAIETLIPQWAGFLHIEEMHPIGVFGSATFILIVLGVVLDRFGASLQHALSATRARERELEALRDSLELVVSERTVSLQSALIQGEKREEQLARTLAQLQENRNLVRDMSSPVLPVLPGVLVAPLVGAIDDERAVAFEQNILSQVEQQRTRHVIFDITGVPLVDTQVAQILLRTASAVRLLGAEALLVGVRPEVAQTLVALGARLDNIPTYSNLREAVAVLARTGKSR